MASTYSPSLRLELIGDGDQSGIWGQTTNNNLGALLEQAVAGVITISMTDANYTLSNFNGVVDESRNQILVLTGALTAQRNLVAPLVEKTYVVKNTTTGGQSVQIIGSSGLGVVIPNGVAVAVYCDGINFYNAISGIAGNLTVSGSLTVGGLPAGFAPTGSVTMYAAASAPTGWLLCNGAAVSRTTYASLFAVVGTTFGAGDGSTTFNTPNYTNRMPYGTTIGTTGGSANATLVSHNHGGITGVDSPDHAHYVNLTTGGQSANHVHDYIQGDPSIAGGGAGGRIGDYHVGQTAGVSNDHVHGVAGYTSGVSANHQHSIALDGTSATNANLPPYLGINFIIKT